MTDYPATHLTALGTDDVDAVVALEAAIFPEDPWTQGMVAEELRSRARHYVGVRTADAPREGMAEVDAPEVGEIVAYAGVSLGVDAEVMTIGVLPHWRGRGLGTALLRDLIRAARAGGAERIFLEVRASNASAQRLYEGQGFTRIGRIRNYFRHPKEDAVTMRALTADLPPDLE